MSNLVKKIKSRGFWDVAIRPGEFNERLLDDISALEPLIRNAAVEIRGWDFPHISREGPAIGVDWIEDETDWEEHVEYWRFYQSGQFLHLNGFRTDWMEQSHYWRTVPNSDAKGLLPVQDTLYRFVEVFEFAARLASGPIPAPVVVLELKLIGLENRTLWIENPNRAGFSAARKATIQEFPQIFTLSRDEAMSSARMNAFRAARELFKRFGWAPDDKLLEGMLDELRRDGYKV